MIVKKLCISISIIATLYIATKSKLVDAQYYGGGLENQHSEGYSGYEGYHNGYGPSEEVDSRPKVQLGIRLKIPAIKFELPRVNLPKITVSAKIRQPDGPRVIQLPEINLDTSSKVAPPGAQVATGQSGYNYMHGNANYGNQKPNHYGSENVQTFSFSTHGDESPKPNLPSHNNYANQYQFGSNYGSQSYNNLNRQPSYFMPSQNQNYNANDNYKRKTITNESYRTIDTDPDIGFNSPVYLEPGQPEASNLVFNHATPMNQPVNHHKYSQFNNLFRKFYKNRSARH